eukprot:8735867-Pyramimonas_sp.AAC.1
MLDLKLASSKCSTGSSSCPAPPPDDISQEVQAPALKRSRSVIGMMRSNSTMRSPSMLAVYGPALPFLALARPVLPYPAPPCA